MLDNITKKNIDDCRDVLVGKVPDPKSQIEQITIALIYKFMDDMDKEAVEKFKGKPKFFAPPKKTGDPKVDKKQIDYSKYGWRKLFDPKLGGKEMLELYSEALDKLQTNPNIPELFRNIFKNAYLPYRDPGTLKLFLKHIHSFEYSHSEKLGDAFEYLLSVMGSQGDAGQFRTPRHIIDFVTACVNPQKNETVLDPACGTAGFLLSAYKHILKQNSTPLSKKTSDHLPSPAGEGGRRPDEGEGRPGGALTPDQRKKLATNFVGYDISPDMVRLSLANMYLHGFATPQIHEYDSLSSEDRWNETFDVILANPPFMTPKGGIRPHKKFGVQANKAEVLFTDYIAEHLNNNGRAGIVVPNGIVATSQTAYKQLRKMLVTDCLIAVISLPAGVFQPYSGVKTSVLILDKRLAKKSQHILFLKIDNDGFDLGAQRREIDKNDLPEALEILQRYKEIISSDEPKENIEAILKNPKDLNVCSNEKNGIDATPMGSKTINNNASINIESLRDSGVVLVKKETVLANKDIVLSAERYFESEKSQTEFDLVKLGDYYELFNGFAFDSNSISSIKNADSVPIIKIGNVIHGDDVKLDIEFVSEKLHQGKKNAIFIGEAFDIFIALSGATTGKISKLPITFAGNKFALNQRVALIKSKSESASSKYLYYVLLNGGIYEMLLNLAHGAAQPNLSSKQISELEIPLPPLEIQQQIVAEMEGYQKIIDGAKQVVNNYKPTININPEWQIAELGTLAKLIGGSTPSKENSAYWSNGNIDWITCSDFSNDTMYIENSIRKITEKAVKENSTSIIPKDTLVLVTRVSLGKMAFVRKPTALNQDLTALIFNEEQISKRYAYFFLLSIADKIENDGHGATVKGVTRDYVKEIKVPLPPIDRTTSHCKRY
jgi:type I restriction enzyme M protein